MSVRTLEDKDVDDLLDDVRYLWASNGPAGARRGRKAIIELLYRWGYLPADYWELPEGHRTDMVIEMSNEEAVATLAREADERDLDHGFYLNRV